MPTTNAGLAGQIDTYLKQKGSPMAGTGQIYVAAGKKYGVDPRLAVAISGAESSFGKKLFQPFNAWGWMSGDKYGSWAQSINAVTKGIYEGYLSQGLRTPAEIVSKWAPASDGNDESVWSGNVSTFMRELGAVPATTTKKVVVAPSPPPPAKTVPTSAGTFKLPTLPTFEPSTAGIRGALISNLQLIGQRGHASGSDLLSGVLQGQLQDVQTDEANQAYLDALKKAMPQPAPQAAPAATPAAPAASATPDTSTPETPSAPAGAHVAPLKTGEVIGHPYEGTHAKDFNVRGGSDNWESENAVDVSVPTGTPVLAPFSGTIGTQFGSLGSGGRFAGLRLHVLGANDEAYLAHLSKIASGIKPGAQVKAGQIVGYSGEANGVQHLHFGLKNGDPDSYFS